MLLGGKGVCQNCTCVPCDACAATCTNPHSGSAFAVVWNRYSSGSQIGNPTDGYLTASGDVQMIDPIPTYGMEGSGPWSQAINGSFGWNGTQDRFPCTIRISLWRANAAIGSLSVPPSSSTVTAETYRVTCTTGRIVVNTDTVLSAGEYYEASGIPLVSSLDGSTNDPHSSVSIQVRPGCDKASFSITATVSWNVKKRQHFVYGIVRECYEVGTPCATACSGSAPPTTLYLTISNMVVTSLISGYGSGGVAIFNSIYSSINQTYVLSRIPNFCFVWDGSGSGGECDGVGGLAGIYVQVLSSSTSGRVAVYVQTGRGNDCCESMDFLATFSGGTLPICGSWSRSGTGTSISSIGQTRASVWGGSFDWSITT